MTTATPPVLVFGFDAGDPDLMLRWAQDGTLPVLGSILKRGCWARLAGPEMISEHGMWVSITTGISRAEHGYYYFRQLVPGTYDLRPERGRTINADPFWVSCPDKRVAIIDVPDIAVPTPLHGIQLSEWATHHPYFPPSSDPPELLDRVRRDFGEQMVIHEEPDCSFERDRVIFDALMQRAQKKKRLCLDLIDSDGFDLVYVVFGECHTGAHQFWKYREEKSSGKAADLSHAVRDIYREIDAALGAILEKLPDDTTVFVVSSVGIKDQWPAFGLNEAFCHQLGYQASPAASAPTSFSPMNLLRRLLPQSARDQLSRFLSRDTQERLISQKFRCATDWSRTTAFSIPGYYSGQFRMNLMGREPEGIVATGTEYEELLDRMESDLRALIDPATNKPAVKSVWRTSSLFNRGVPDKMPDLFAEWADAEHFVERVLHPKTELRQEPCDFHRGTDHSQFGFLAAAGNSLSSSGDLGDVCPLDIAPTMLTHLQSRIPESLAGRVIPQMSAGNLLSKDDTEA